MNDQPKMNSDAEEFAELGGQYDAKAESERKRAQQGQLKAQAETVETVKGEEDDGLPSQYKRWGGGFMPCSSTVPKLPPGCYNIYSTDQGPYAEPAPPPSGLLLELPEMRSEHVISLVERFWASENDYKLGNEFVHGGAAFRSGIMIFGPPGSGKSCTIKIVSKKLIQRGGTVFYADQHPNTVSRFLEEFGRIEPNRKCVVILEDVDSLIEQFGEAKYLAMLDSGTTIDNVLFLATTNYPERLDPRIYNRPGRFSHVVKIGMPTPAAREAFLKAILKSHRDVPQLVELSEGFSIDHISALVNAVYREGKELTAEAERLRAMFKIPKIDHKAIGLGAKP